MNEGSFQPLGEVLRDPSAFAWSEWLFLTPELRAWSADTQTFAVDDGAMESEMPEQARRAKLTLSLSMQAVQDVCSNLRDRAEEPPDTPLLVEALVTYAETDAFPA